VNLLGDNIDAIKKNMENLIILIIFGPKRDDVTGDWRKLHNEELHNLYSSPNIIRKNKSRGVGRAGHVARMVEKRNAYRILVKKPKGKSSVRRPRRRWVDNIKMKLRDRMGWHGLERSDSG
jgi:hypothetical protein